MIHSQRKEVATLRCCGDVIREYVNDYDYMIMIPLAVCVEWCNRYCWCVKWDICLRLTTVLKQPTIP